MLAKAVRTAKALAEPHRRARLYYRRAQQLARQLDDDFALQMATHWHHTALILDLAQHGRICLGGDVGHLREGYDQMIPMPWDWSTSAMTMTRMRMKQLERSGVPVFLCHDPDDFAKLPSNGEYWD